MPPDVNPATPPHEPEIELLRKAATFLLFAFRTATVIAALVSLTYGIANIVDPPEYSWPPFGPGDIGVGRMPIAPYFVWLCIGIPPLVSTKWLFGRGRWPMLVVGAALWFGPMLLEGDHDYAFLLRFFASLVAVSVLFVWKSVFALTQRAS